MAVSLNLSLESSSTGASTSSQAGTLSGRKVSLSHQDVALSALLVCRISPYCQLAIRNKERDFRLLGDLEAKAHSLLEPKNEYCFSLNSTSSQKQKEVMRRLEMRFNHVSFQGANYLWGLIASLLCSIDKEAIKPPLIKRFFGGIILTASRVLSDLMTHPSKASPAYLKEARHINDFSSYAYGQIFIVLAQRLPKQKEEILEALSKETPPEDERKLFDHLREAIEKNSGEEFSHSMLTFKICGAMKKGEHLAFFERLEKITGHLPMLVRLLKWIGGHPDLKGIVDDIDLLCSLIEDESLLPLLCAPLIQDRTILELDLDLLANGMIAALNWYEDAFQTFPFEQEGPIAAKHKASLLSFLKECKKAVHALIRMNAEVKASPILKNLWSSEDIARSLEVIREWSLVSQTAISLINGGFEKILSPFSDSEDPWAQLALSSYQDNLGFYSTLFASVYSTLFDEFKERVKSFVEIDQTLNLHLKQYEDLQVLSHSKLFSRAELMAMLLRRVFEGQSWEERSADVIECLDLLSLFLCKSALPLKRKEERRIHLQLVLTALSDLRKVVNEKKSLSPGKKTTPKEILKLLSRSLKSGCELQFILQPSGHGLPDKKTLRLYIQEMSGVALRFLKKHPLYQLPPLPVLCTTLEMYSELAQITISMTEEIKLLEEKLAQMTEIAPKELDTKMQEWLTFYSNLFAFIRKGASWEKIFVNFKLINERKLLFENTQKLAVCLLQAFPSLEELTARIEMQGRLLSIEVENLVFESLRGMTEIIKFYRRTPSSAQEEIVNVESVIEEKNLILEDRSPQTPRQITYEEALASLEAALFNRLETHGSAALEDAARGALPLIHEYLQKPLPKYTFAFVRALAVLVENLQNALLIAKNKVFVGEGSKRHDLERNHAVLAALGLEALLPPLNGFSDSKKLYEEESQGQATNLCNDDPRSLALSTFLYCDALFAMLFPRCSSSPLSLGSSHNTYCLEKIQNPLVINMELPQIKGHFGQMRNASLTLIASKFEELKTLAKMESIEHPSLFANEIAMTLALMIERALMIAIAGQEGEGALNSDVACYHRSLNRVHDLNYLAKRLSRTLSVEAMQEIDFFSSFIGIESRYPSRGAKVTSDILMLAEDRLNEGLTTSAQKRWLKKDATLEGSLSDLVRHVPAVLRLMHEILLQTQFLQEKRV